MELEKSEEEIASLIAEALRVTLDQDDDGYIFDLNTVGVERVLRLEKSTLNDIISSLSEFEASGETAIATPRVYETLVREESHFPRMLHRLRDDDFEVSDTENNIEYRLSKPSNEYLIYLIVKVAEISSPRALVVPMPLRRVFERPRENEIDTVFELLRRILPRFLTLRIESVRNRSLLDLERYSSAFLFQLSYNLDVALVPQRHIEELIRTGRINRVRRVAMDEIDPPRRHYIPDLVHHYQLAVGTDNPFLEFISYYHITEYFFETVFNEDLVLRIKDKLTAPDFSYKRKKDIGKLIKDIGKSLQVRNETITFSEQEALRLTILAHVNLTELSDKLNEYDDSLLDYYKDSKVPFSDGDAIDFNGLEGEPLAKKIAARIYKTRNAIVHSKESERARYTPFKDDQSLVREIPLVRFVAEQTIISTSSVVG